MTAAQIGLIVLAIAVFCIATGFVWTLIVNIKRRPR
jgi:hypothetical protein